MNRRHFICSTAALAAAPLLPAWAQDAASAQFVLKFPSENALGEIAVDATKDTIITCAYNPLLQSRRGITLRDTFASLKPHQTFILMAQGDAAGNPNGYWENVGCSGGKVGMRAYGAQFHTIVRAKLHGSKTGLLIDNAPSGGGGNTISGYDVQMVDNMGAALIVYDRNRKYGLGDSNTLYNPEIHGATCGVFMPTTAVQRIRDGTVEYVGRPNAQVGDPLWDPVTCDTYFGWDMAALSPEVIARCHRMPHALICLRERAKLMWDRPSIRVAGTGQEYVSILEDDAVLEIESPEGGQNSWQRMVAHDRARMHLRGTWMWCGTYFGVETWPESYDLTGGSWASQFIGVSLPGAAPQGAGSKVVALQANKEWSSGKLGPLSRYESTRQAGVSCWLRASVDCTLELMGHTNAGLPFRGGEWRRMRAVLPASGGIWTDYGIRLRADREVSVDLVGQRLVVDSGWSAGAINAM